MALNDEGGNGIPATMLVGPTGYGGGMPYPVYQNGGGNGGGGWDNGNGWWIILLFILLASGNWGNQNNGGFGGGQPIIMTDGNGGNGGAIQRGFDQSAIMGGLNGIQTSVQNLSAQLCNCCGDMQMAMANGFAGVEQGANARQIANMQTAFAGQTAMMQGLNAVQAQLAQCCADNRAATNDLRYTIATENCADRAALSDGVRDILTSQNAGIQRILDQLCQDKIDAKNDLIAQLRSELQYARGQASQDVQTAQLRAGQMAAVDSVYQRMRECPVPTMPVYGMTPIFTCPNNGGGCGCGCNS